MCLKLRVWYTPSKHSSINKIQLQVVWTQSITFDLRLYGTCHSTCYMIPGINYQELRSSASSGIGNSIRK